MAIEGHGTQVFMSVAEVRDAEKSCSAALAKDAELCSAIRLADQLRAKHNGIGEVCLHLTHDGNNVCRLRDGDGRDVGHGESGKSLRDAVQKAAANRRLRAFWERNTVADVALRVGFGHGNYCVLTTEEFRNDVASRIGEDSISIEDADGLLQGDPRIVRLKSGNEWLLLPDGRERSV